MARNPVYQRTDVLFKVLRLFRTLIPEFSGVARCLTRQGQVVTLFFLLICSLPATANQPPNLPELPDQRVLAGTVLEIVIAPTDVDGDVPGVFLVNPPASSEFPDNFNGTRTFRWSTNSTDIGVHRLHFVAEDARDRSLTESGYLDVTVHGDASFQTQPRVDELQAVNTGNALPILNLLEEHTIQVNNELSFLLAPTDPDGDVPGVYLDNPPAGAVLPDNRDGTRTFRWRPEHGQKGIYRLDFVVQDARDSTLDVTHTVTVNVVDETVSDSRLPPVVETASIATDQLERPESAAEATRFLTRATFGPRAGEIEQVLSLGFEGWVDLQQSLPFTSHLARLDAGFAAKSLQHVGLTDRLFEKQLVRSDTWWDIVVNAEDQLRQRVAFALSQIFVVSQTEAGLENRIRGFVAYNDLLLQHAFGNYRELLTAVTLNPVMGDFLSMRRNEKADDSNNIQPDQNYARELMQLFTLGLDLLHQNGEPVLDSSGASIPTYTENDVSELARVLTGWSYGDAGELRTNSRTYNSEVIPMRFFAEFHDSGSKNLLGVEIPAGLSAAEDLERALDVLFQHGNVGPFTAKQLIQRLVTSNPTPEYIARVAAVFNDNGSGVRGDLKAVVKAILLDREALQGHRLYPDWFGKLKEPLIKIASVWRSLLGRGEFGYFRYWDTTPDLAQESFAAPSVFNFYQPDYSPPGDLRNSGLVAPEFQILNEHTILRAADRLFDYAFAVPLGGDDSSNQHRVNLGIAPLLALASDPGRLIEKLNELLLAGSMSAAMKEVLLQHANETPLEDDGSMRVRETLFLILVSPEFAVQR